MVPMVDAALDCNLIARLQGLRLSVFGEGLKVPFVPSKEQLEEAFQQGLAFAESIKEA